MVIYLVKGKENNYVITDKTLREYLNNDKYCNIVGTYILDTNRVLEQLKEDLPDVEIIHQVNVEK